MFTLIRYSDGEGAKGVKSLAFVVVKMFKVLRIMIQEGSSAVV